MTNKEYNGWTNYETWNVALWMDNDEGSDAYWSEQAQDIYNRAEAGTFTKEEQAQLDFADALQEHFESESQDLLEMAKVQCSVWADLLGAALSEVNWYEIAGHKIDDVDKQETETA